MDCSPFDHTRWNNRLALDLALALEGSGEPVADVLSRHEIDQDTLMEMSKDPLFSRTVDGFRDEIRDKGLSFKLKARAQAEELLKTSWLLIHDPMTAPSVKADLIKHTVRWAGYEAPSVVDTSGNASAGGVRITINLGGAQVGVEQAAPALPADVVDVEASYTDEEQCDVDD